MEVMLLAGLLGLAPFLHSKLRYSSFHNGVFFGISPESPKNTNKSSIGNEGPSCEISSGTLFFALIRTNTPHKKPEPSVHMSYLSDGNEGWAGCGRVPQNLIDPAHYNLLQVIQSSNAWRKYYWGYFSAKLSIPCLFSLIPAGDKIK